MPYMPTGHVFGSTTPRLYTPPLVTGPAGPCGCGCALTPATSYGFDVVQFAAEILGRPLDPWQRWLVIHAGELLDDGRPRFRRVVVIVARQNGKTEVCVVLSLYWLFVEAVGLVLGTSTKLDYAKESWVKAVRLAERAPALDALRPKRWKREANGEQECWTVEDARYKIAAANDDAGRSLTVARLVCDELRQHRTYATWNAAYNAMNAVPDGQAWGITNMGDASSLVLNDLRAAALTFVRKGEGDPRLGLFEWSCPTDADPLDLDALAQANPSLGRGRLDADTLLGQAQTAVAAGGDALTGFRTEVMCVKVPNMRPALDAAAWSRLERGRGLDRLRRRVAVALDASPDQLHATLYAAAVDPADGRVVVDLVRDWSGPAALTRAVDELPALLARIRPRAFGWLPSGPAAAGAARLADRTRKGVRGWPPAGVTVEAIKGETAAVCMGLGQLVDARRLVLGADPLLDDQATTAERRDRPGDTWVFAPADGRHVDAVYAAAAAAHLAQTLPADPGRPRVVVVDDE